MAIILWLINGCDPNYPSKIEWDRIPTDPVQQVAIEPIDTQVERGPFRNGPVGDFLDNYLLVIG